MDEQQRQRINDINQAMTNILMRRVDHLGIWGPDVAVRTAPHHSVSDEETEAQLLALVPDLVVVVRGLWDMHTQELAHTQGPQSPALLRRPDSDEQDDTVPVAERMSAIASVVEYLWDQHLGELPHPAFEPMSSEQQ